MTALDTALDDAAEAMDRLAIDNETQIFVTDVANVAMRRLPGLDSWIVTKRTAGFRQRDVDAFSEILEDALDEEPKFVVFDFAHRSAASTMDQCGVEEMADLVHASANLIAHSSVVTIAWARGEIADADMELALSCSMIAAEGQARFAFSPYGCAYTFLARKIGVARAERAMLNSDELDATAMRDMLLVRHVEETSGRGDAAIEEFVGGHLRRHNALAHMYRAQRLVMPVPYELVRGVHQA
jgi:enoyl-CoA hydratase/carnithine racemase